MEAVFFRVSTSGANEENTKGLQALQGIIVFSEFIARQRVMSK